MKQSVIATVDVAVDDAAAFRIFTEEIDAWWERGPHNFYDSRRAVAMRFEPGVGGRYLEIYDEAAGDVLEIGRITVWEPGRRLVFRLSLNDTEVDIRFEPIPTGTRVMLEQRTVPPAANVHFYTGWPNILGWFARGALLARLGVAPDDAAEVLRTMPPSSQLQPHAEKIAAALAHRSQPGDPMPTLPSSESPLFAAHVILAAFDSIRECHCALGVADAISWETLSHLGRAMAAYRRAHGRPGIALTFWDWLRYLGWLYQVGRLEVTVYRLRTHPKEAGPLFWYDDETAAGLNLPFRIGDPALSIHIPPTDPLAPDACDESFARIRAGFPGRRVATCTSWLLDDQLAEYLPADSNILAFQHRFHLVPGGRDDDDSILRYVFGPDRPAELDALPQDTALRRAIVRHLRSGRHWQMRTGWLALRA